MIQIVRMLHNEHTSPKVLLGHAELLVKAILILGNSQFFIAVKAVNILRQRKPEGDSVARIF